MTDVVPLEMRDLLIRLDQRVADGFDNVNKKLEAMDRRADSIDQRVTALEKWQTETQTTTANARKWGAIAWSVIGSAVTGIIGWIIVTYIHAVK